MSPAFAASTAVAARLSVRVQRRAGPGFLARAIADDDVVAVRDRESRELASDLPGADESNGSHDEDYNAAYRATSG